MVVSFGVISSTSIPKETAVNPTNLNLRKLRNAAQDLGNRKDWRQRVRTASPHASSIHAAVVKSVASHMWNREIAQRSMFRTGTAVTAWTQHINKRKKCSAVGKGSTSSLDSLLRGTTPYCPRVNPTTRAATQPTMEARSCDGPTSQQTSLHLAKICFLYLSVQTGLSEVMFIRTATLRGEGELSKATRSKHAEIKTIIFKRTEKNWKFLK